MLRRAKVACLISELSSAVLWVGMGTRGIGGVFEVTLESTGGDKGVLNAQPCANPVNPSAFGLKMRDVDGVGSCASSHGVSSGGLVGISCSRDILETARVQRDEWELHLKLAFVWFDSEAVGVLAPHTCRQLCIEVGGSTCGAVLVYVGAGTCTVDVALMGDLVDSGIGGAGAANGGIWAGSLYLGVGLGTRE